MSTRKLEVNWNDMNMKLRQELDMFTDNDLLLIEIKLNKISGRFQNNLLNTNEDVQNLISL